MEGGRPGTGAGCGGGGVSDTLNGGATSMGGYNMRGSGSLPPRGPPPGGGNDFTGGQEWRLPPMPEMPPLPNFDTRQMAPPRTNGSQYGGISRARAPPRGPGVNAPRHGFLSPNNMPGLSGPRGGRRPPPRGTRPA